VEGGDWGIMERNKRYKERGKMEGRGQEEKGLDGMEKEMEKMETSVKAAVTRTQYISAELFTNCDAML